MFLSLISDLFFSVFTIDLVVYDVVIWFVIALFIFCKHFISGVRCVR